MMSGGEGAGRKLDGRGCHRYGDLGSACYLPVCYKSSYCGHMSWYRVVSVAVLHFRRRGAELQPGGRGCHRRGVQGSGCYIPLSYQSPHCRHMLWNRVISVVMLRFRRRGAGLQPGGRGLPQAWGPGQRLLACGAQIIAELRLAVREELGYSCSAG